MAIEVRIEMRLRQVQEEEEKKSFRKERILIHGINGHMGRSRVHSERRRRRRRRHVITLKTKFQTQTSTTNMNLTLTSSRVNVSLENPKYLIKDTTFPYVSEFKT